MALRRAPGILRRIIGSLTGEKRTPSPSQLTFSRERLQNAESVGLLAFGQYVHARLPPGELVPVADFTRHALNAARWMELEKENARDKLSQDVVLTKQNARWLGLLGEAHNEVHPKTTGIEYNSKEIVLRLAAHAGNAAFVKAVRNELQHPTPTK